MKILGIVIVVLALVAGCDTGGCPVPLDENGICKPSFFYDDSCYQAGCSDSCSDCGEYTSCDPTRTCESACVVLVENRIQKALAYCEENGFLDCQRCKCLEEGKEYDTGTKTCTKDLFEGTDSCTASDAIKAKNGNEDFYISIIENDCNSY